MQFLHKNPLFLAKTSRKQRICRCFEELPPVKFSRPDLAIIFIPELASAFFDVIPRIMEALAISSNKRSTHDKLVSTDKGGKCCDQEFTNHMRDCD